VGRTHKDEVVGVAVVLFVAQLRDIVLLDLRDRRRKARPHFVHGHSEAMLWLASRRTLRGARNRWWRTPMRRGGPDMPGRAAAHGGGTFVSRDVMSVDLAAAQHAAHDASVWGRRKHGVCGMRACAQRYMPLM